jgi:hypothetical protein
MLYKKEELPHYVKTAGKITVLTAFAGLLVFMFALVFDFGTQEFNRVSAQSATTTLTVLNTPPAFTLDAYEVIESSTSTPTNSGDVLQWAAIGTDSNAAPYFLLICSTNASPTAFAAAGPGSLGTQAPACDAADVQWGVSASTTSGELAVVSTTTTEIAPFDESNEWYAWVCDDDPNNPRCVNFPSQGYSATNSSPFKVNKRPVLSDFANNGPADPGATFTFFSTSTDPDIDGGADELFLIVCNSNLDYSTVTNTCATSFVASTSIGALSDASATYTLAAIVRDNTYGGYGYLIDEHGHEALASPLQADFIVNNVAPTVSGGDIILNGGLNLVLTIPAGETPSSTLDFKIKDANSCVTFASSSEITNFTVSVFRSSLGTTTCDGTAGPYDPNNCYPSGVGPDVWDLSCAATSSCPDDASQDFVDYACTFPLWFVADPTDPVGTTPAAFQADNWSVGVSGSDNNFATGTMATTSSNAVELIQFAAIDIEDAEIAYGGVEPGTNTGTLSATSTALNVGNTGLDQEVIGESMCGTFTSASLCAVSASSTIPADQQQVASSTLPYGDALATALSSTTEQEIELDVLKTTSTSTPNTATTYWGISVPIAITLAGDYTGLNTFIAVTAEANDWQ